MVRVLFNYPQSVYDNTELKDLIHESVISVIRMTRPNALSSDIRKFPSDNDILEKGFLNTGLSGWPIWRFNVLEGKIPKPNLYSGAFLSLSEYENLERQTKLSVVKLVAIREAVRLIAGNEDLFKESGHQLDTNRYNCALTDVSELNDLLLIAISTASQGPFCQACTVKIQSFKIE
jgi:hypothetical protein